MIPISTNSSKPDEYGAILSNSEITKNYNNLSIDEIYISTEDKKTDSKKIFRINYGIIIPIFLIGIIFATSGYFSSINTFLSKQLRYSNLSSDLLVDSVNDVKPNVIIILADDLGWNSVGYTFQDMEYLTPTITKLAKGGIIMNNFYAQEVCTPSRASLLTGRYPLSVGMQYGMILSTAEWGMPLDEITIAEVLKDYDYKTHILGKWHLGHFSPQYLPTSRGFDDFTGFLNGEDFYWSKHSPDYSEFVDFLQSDTTCYGPYQGLDINEYSTTLYTNKALDIIDSHSKDESLFLYLSYQAVHDPFIDYDDTYYAGIPDYYLPSEVLNSINLSNVGLKRKEYMKALYLLDESIGRVYDKLDEKDMLDNTYIIFLSDNGGCHSGGGKNGPLRGSKGSLFEGAVKVSSFISSPLLKDNQGLVYDGLMHISDWFPTILSLTNIEYTPTDKHLLDGFNQVPGWKGLSTPRSSMLYNIYASVTDHKFDIWKDGSFAIRNDRYKLMHTYDDAHYGGWYDPTTKVDGDNNLEDLDTYRCAQQFLKGDFTYWLFDLSEDPYEQNNLYNSDKAEHIKVKEELYSMLPDLISNSKVKPGIVFSNAAKDYWTEHDSHVMPWETQNNLASSMKKTKTSPSLCQS